MASSFLIPIVTWLPRGYDCTIVMPPEALAAQLNNGSGAIERSWQAIAGGEVVQSGNDILTFEKGVLISGPADHIRWGGASQDSWPGAGGFLEFSVCAANDQQLFNSNQLPGFYNVYEGPGLKSFFTCHTWKFGSPQVISQIAKFKRYVDAYPVIHIDRDLDLGDSLVLINPYMKPVLCQVLASDGQQPSRIRIAAQSVVKIDLANLLAPDAPSWMGQIQLTANNRLVTYIVKHSLSDPDRITTVEHLDPFRADPTHAPWFAWLRNKAGWWLRDRAVR